MGHTRTVRVREVPRPGCDTLVVQAVMGCKALYATSCHDIAHTNHELSTSSWRRRPCFTLADSGAGRHWASKAALETMADARDQAGS